MELGGMAPTLKQTIQLPAGTHSPFGALDLGFRT